MTIGEGTTGAVHVVQNYKNVKIHGISKGTVEKVIANILPSNFKLDIDLILSSLKLEADYDFNGQILVIPIVGKGNCTVNLSNVKAKLVLTGKSFEKKGKTYIDIQKAVMSLKPEKVHFDFANLFNGDQRLGAEMNKLLNDNSEVVFEDVGSGYEASLAIVVQNMCNLIYHKVPFGDLFPL
ncbi:hypothetical protein ILUMI_05356 [Ignelater luminosus]|uniref:Uncharacterized protein n=1 Tax=Ignelater luminosus TaxID=2038154 RepID=A0A8K0DD33_IGNLU|nr:hypothetical protein ILUMI_05356 [Ignelater luminosus]